MLFNFKMSGAIRFEQILRNLENAVSDLQPLFKEFAKDWRKTMDKVFTNKGAVDGRQRWKGLDPDYRKYKAKKFPGKQLLVETGAMKRSFTEEGGNHIELTSNSSLTIGSRDPKAKYHQTGTNDMPQRTLIEFTDVQANRWLKIAEQYFKRRAGTGL